METITGINEVRDFLGGIIKVLGSSFHPDDPFPSYVDAYGNRIFSDWQCAEYEKRMGECFDACENVGEDIYRIAMEILSAEGYIRYR